MLGGGDASNAARAAIQSGVPSGRAGPTSEPRCAPPRAGGSAYRYAVIPPIDGAMGPMGAAAPGSPAPGAVVQAVESCTISTTRSGSWAAPLHPEGLPSSAGGDAYGLTGALLLAAPPPAGLPQERDRPRLPPAPRWAAGAADADGEEQQQQLRLLAAAKHAAAALFLPSCEAHHRPAATPAGAAAAAAPSPASPSSPLMRPTAPAFSGAGAAAAIAARGSLAAGSGGAAAAAAGQTPTGTEPALARELGVTMASLERLFRADAQFDYEQPVWMVVNLSGKIKGSYTADKMVEFCRRGTLSARQLILGIDRDLPYTYRQDLGFYRPLGRLSAEVHAGGRYVPLSAARAGVGSNGVPWVPVVAAGPAAGDGGALAAGLSGLSLGGAAAADSAAAATDAISAEASGTAATARSNSALRAALQRLFVPGGPANKRQMMWLYVNHLGWCRGPFSGGKLLHAHLCGRLPKDTLVVGYTPGVPVFMLSGDVPTWFRPLGALLDNVAQGYTYNPVSWKTFMEHSHHANQPGAASDPQPLWCPLVWPGPGEAPPLLNPQQVLLPPPPLAGSGGSGGGAAASAGPWVGGVAGTVGLMAAGQQQPQMHPPGLGQVAGLMQLEVSSGMLSSSSTQPMQQLQPALAMPPGVAGQLSASSQEQQLRHAGLPSHMLLVASGDAAAAVGPGLCGCTAPAGFGVAGGAAAAGGPYEFAGAAVSMPQGYAHAVLTNAGQSQQLHQVTSQVLLQGPVEGLFGGAGVQQQQMFAAGPACFPAGGQTALLIGGGVAAPAQLHGTAGMPAASAAALQLGGGPSQWLGFSTAPQGL